MLRGGCLPYNGITPSPKKPPPVANPHHPPPTHKLSTLIKPTHQTRQPIQIFKIRTITNDEEIPSATNTVSLARLFRALCCCCGWQKKNKKQSYKVTNEKGLREFIEARRNRRVDTILMEERSGRKTLVLDLDDTLVHSSYEAQKWDFKVEFELNGEKKTAYTKMRYGLSRFLEVMNQYYELIIFTGGIPDLACKVIDQIDPNNYIKHRVYRQNCIQVDYANKIFLKNLKILNRRLQDVVLLDNSKNSGLLNPENLLLIPNFYQDQKDKQLVKLIPFLIYLSGLKDVRVVEERRYAYYKEKPVRMQARSSKDGRRTLKMDVEFQESSGGIVGDRGDEGEDGREGEEEERV